MFPKERVSLPFTVVLSHLGTLQVFGRAILAVSLHCDLCTTSILSGDHWLLFREIKSNVDLKKNGEQSTWGQIAARLKSESAHRRYWRGDRRGKEGVVVDPDRDFTTSVFSFHALIWPLQSSADCFWAANKNMWVERTKTLAEFKRAESEWRGSVQDTAHTPSLPPSLPPSIP